MDKQLSTPLEVHEIDFRIQSINKGGYATILAYKNARADMQRLDDCIGPMYWKREHIRDNKNCIVSIWCKANNHWVGKEDTGTESSAEAAKGLASDAFKRACFNWGIGRELYDYPMISVKLNPDEFSEFNGKMKQTWNLKLKDWRWKSEFTDGKLTYLGAIDNNKKLRFEYKK